MQIIFSKTAKKNIEKMPKEYKRLIHDGIIGLSKIPPEGDIKPIQGSADDLYRLRVGKYRVIYQYLTDSGEKYIYINDVGVRGDIYK